jgi:hypothetical protein
MINIKFGDWNFRSKKECTVAVKAEVDPHKKAFFSPTEFFSPLVADLFLHRHYALSKFNIRPVGFLWGIHPRYATDECFFLRIDDAQFPNILDWRVASWRKAIDDWKLTEQTLDAELASYYRRLTLPIAFSYRDSRMPKCELDGCQQTENLDVHHIEPTFYEIANAITALLTQAERTELIRTHNWFDEKQWLLPQKCINAIKSEHQNAKFMLVCKQHHYQMKKGNSYANC